MILVDPFSWSNNKENPIMTKLDRIIASIEWNTIYPLAKVTKLEKGSSGHNPLRITFGENIYLKEPIFRFENGG
jgi:hypothetical protein